MRSKLFNNVVKLAESLENLSESYDMYILFIDLCDSTAIKQYCIENEIPDLTWIMRLKVFLSRTAQIIQQYSGSIIKTIGDEVMATFPLKTNPSEIIKCTIEIFQTFENLKSYNKGKFKIYSKAAIDFGTCYDGQLINPNLVDPIGPAVDRCARLGKYVNKNEIIVSNDFYDLLVENSFNFSKYSLLTGEEDLKGLGIVKYYKLAFVNSTKTKI